MPAGRHLNRAPTARAPTQFKSLDADYLMLRKGCFLGWTGSKINRATIIRPICPSYDFSGFANENGQDMLHVPLSVAVAF